jgi:hypothetical protein
MVSWDNQKPSRSWIGIAHLLWDNGEHGAEVVETQFGYVDSFQQNGVHRG